MKNLALLCAAVVAVAASPAWGQNPALPDLKTLPKEHQVASLSFCNGVYKVTLKSGLAVEFPEFNLRFKTDGSENGPSPGAPRIVGAGMRGDRAYLIFSSAPEISKFVQRVC